MKLFLFFASYSGSNEDDRQNVRTVDVNERQSDLPISTAIENETLAAPSDAQTPAGRRKFRPVAPPMVLNFLRKPNARKKKKMTETMTVRSPPRIKTLEAFRNTNGRQMSGFCSYVFLYFSDFKSSETEV